MKNLLIQTKILGRKPIYYKLSLEKYLVLSKTLANATKNRKIEIDELVKNYIIIKLK